MRPEFFSLLLLLPLLRKKTANSILTRMFSPPLPLSVCQSNFVGTKNEASARSRGEAANFGTDYYTSRHVWWDSKLRERKHQVRQRESERGGFWKCPKFAYSPQVRPTQLARTKFGSAGKWGHLTGKPWYGCAGYAISEFQNQISTLSSRPNSHTVLFQTAWIHSENNNGNGCFSKSIKNSIWFSFSGPDVLVLLQ